MRTNIVHAGADELSYEIRGIVSVAEKIKTLGKDIVWENIGDPVAKGEIVPGWIRDTIKKIIDENASFAYSPTQGLLKTREYLAELRKKESGVSISPDDIVFFNGLGDAISKVYTYLNRNARIIGPSPAYPTHSSAEGAHAGSPHITYNLLPDRNWLPDINDLRNKIHYNPQIAGILIINPDNPTGMVYPKKILEEIVHIARKYKLFLISDEIYAHLVYKDDAMTALSEVIGNVPGIAMRGISKELPWPGARSGWVEVYNKETDKSFSRYIKTIIDAKMLEVCSTTLPQMVIPEILSDVRYKEHLRERALRYERRASDAYRILSSVKGILAPKPEGAFYMTVVFKDEALAPNKKLFIQEETIRRFVEEITEGAPFDKRFVYYLLGASGICVVPLSSFNSQLFGFRVTLLEPDDEKFTAIFETLRKKISEFLGS